jgi:hypothetical protein
MTARFTVIPVAALIVSAMLLVTLGALFVWALRRRTAPPRPVSRLAALGELSWLSAPVVVVTTFAATALSIDPIGIWNRVAPANAVVPVAPPREALPPLTSTPLQSEVPIVNTSSKAPLKRPDWLSAHYTDGDSERIVIQSQQYTTAAEAEQELSANARELLARDLLKLRPGTTRPASWNPSADEIRQTMVKEQYIEVVERDFGSFVHPMYRIWWQVELSPEVRTEFLPAWRRGLTSVRVWNIGIVVSTIALLSSLFVTYRRLDILSRGAWSTRLRIAGCGAVLLWVVVIRVLLNSAMMAA